MIKIDKIEVMGWEAAIRGMRNPLESWDMSDSGTGRSYDFVDRRCKECSGDRLCRSSKKAFRYMAGPSDLTLMAKLAKAGPDHRKFMRMITVYADIVAPMYFWSEYDTYKVGTVANSTSKMHKMLARPFEMSDFSFDKLPGYKNEVRQFVPEYDSDEERWLQANDTEYYVSNFGHIKRKGRTLAGSYHLDGYLFVTIKGIQIPLHRLVATAFIPNPNDNPEVNHKDGNKMNNAVENLEWVTRSENQIHAVRLGLQPKNASTYTGKFSDEEREEIKNLWNSGEYSRRKLAEMYNVSHTCINDIINDRYRYATKINMFEAVARPIVDTLNELRDYWVRETDEEKRKEIWYSILQLLPVSYNQKRTVLLNYEVLRNMYHARKNHKLDEWREFCKVIEWLPYSELITETFEGE